MSDILAFFADYWPFKCYGTYDSLIFDIIYRRSIFFKNVLIFWLFFADYWPFFKCIHPSKIAVGIPQSLHCHGTYYSLIFDIISRCSIFFKKVWYFGFFQIIGLLNAFTLQKSLEEFLDLYIVMKLMIPWFSTWFPDVQFSLKMSDILAFLQIIGLFNAFTPQKSLEEFLDFYSCMELMIPWFSTWFPDVWFSLKMSDVLAFLQIIGLLNAFTYQKWLKEFLDL